MTNEPVVNPATVVPTGDTKTGIPAAAQQDLEVEIGGVKYKTSDLKKKLDLANGAQKAMQDLDSLKKNYSNFMDGMKVDPKGTLREMRQQGIITAEEAQKIATEWYRDSVYEPAKMSKEQIEAKEAKLRLEAYERKEKERTASEAKAKQDADAKAAKAYIVGQLQAAFKKHPEIPETADVIRYAAKHKNIAKAAGEPIDYDTAVVRAWTETKGIMKKIAEQHNEDNIMDYIGEDLAEKINKAYLKRLKKKQDPKVDLPLPSDVENKQPERPMSRRERQRLNIQETIRRVTGGQTGR